METLSADLLSSFGTVLAPFALLTSCATLAWGLQNRYSRVVDAIRTLARELQAPGPDEEIVRTEMRLLISRTRAMRNGLIGYYTAMMCFLGTGTLLMLSILTGKIGPGVVVGVFVLGLVIVCWTLVQMIHDTTRSFVAVGRDVTRGRTSSGDLAAR